MNQFWYPVYFVMLFIFNSSERAAKEDKHIFDRTLMQSVKLKH